MVQMYKMNTADTMHTMSGELSYKLKKSYP